MKIMNYGYIWYGSAAALVKTLKGKYKIPASTIGGILIYLAYHFAFQYFSYKQIETRYSRQVGQMVITGFKGTNEADIDNVVDYVQKGYVGGVILFGGTEARERQRSNILNPRQLIVLTSYLQQKATIPLIIATNQEGGLRDNLIDISKLPLIGIKDAFGVKDADLWKDYKQNGREMLLFGFNANLAPAVDIPTSTSKVRITEDVDEISRISKVFIHAYKAAGVKTCLKHFPGIRDYLEPRDLTQYRVQKQVELYRDLINSEHIDMIMVSRDYADLDHGMPGFMSKKTIDYLRSEFNFHGVILTDSIESIENFSKEEVIIKAINAGANIIVTSNSKVYDSQAGKIVHDIIIKAISKGQIDPAKIEESYDRVLALKHRLGENTKDVTF